MKNIIIGTAGHIDHGKTTLIKALTGTNTDRLDEEKKRGITIDLGFTHFQLPSGKKAGIIDVPGHEKFIKNMLAGIGGIDIVLFVIAADEGFMPQTQEHLDILSILQVKKGIIVLTKIDMVDKEWLELVKEDIREKTKDTFLQNASFASVSAKTKEGISELTTLVDEMTEETETKNTKMPFRIPIDRVFSITGFGTVITGTQIEGELNIGDNVLVLPTGIETKIRNIQVHGETVKTSYAGQRVAINLANVKKEDIDRGNVLAPYNSMYPSMMLDVKISLLKSSERILENRTRLRLYHGTSEILCRIVLLDKEELRPGESGYAQLRLEEEMVAKRGDYFVLRFYSPLETIGGGTILDPNPVKHKRFKKDTIEELRIKEEGSSEEVVEKIIKRFSEKLETIEFYGTQTGLGEKMIKELIKPLIEEKIIVIFLDNILVHYSFIEEIEVKMLDILKNYHKNNPLKTGINKEELRSRLLPNARLKLFSEFVDYYCKKGIIKQVNNNIALSSFEVILTETQKSISEELDKIFFDSGFQPPSIEELVKNKKNQKEYRQVILMLTENGTLVKIAEDYYMHYENFNKSIELLKEYINKNNDILLSQFRDLLDTSRKYALPLLEFFDQNKITKRIEEKRILY